MPNHAGLRQYRRARSSGAFIGVYDGIEAGMDTGGGRWQTLCEDHGNIISHATLALAQAHATEPEEWCEGCRGAQAERRQPITTCDCPYKGRVHAHYEWCPLRSHHHRRIGR